MAKTIKVLFITDSREYVESVSNEMSKWGFFVIDDRVSTYEEFKTRYGTEEWDLIISDSAADKLSFAEAISSISAMGDEIPVIVVSEDKNEEHMLEAIEKGCCDYILKNDLLRLRLAVNRITKEMTGGKGRREVLREYMAANEFLINSLDSVGDGVIITDGIGNIIMLNKVAQKCTGWLQRDAIDQPLEKVFNIIDIITRLPAESPFEKVLRERKVTGLKSNTVLITKDLKEKYVSASCAPIVTGNNKFAGIIMVFRDISRIKRIENRIINEKRNLSAIFDAAPAGMLLLDKNATIKKVNAAIYKIAGRKPLTPITDMRVGDIFKCPNRNTCAEGCGYCDKCINCGLNNALREACSSENPINNSDIKYTIFVNEANRKMWLRINSVPIIINEQRHTLVIIDDITGLKQLQEELKESNQGLKNALEELKMTQNHMIQQEKLAGIGQLAAGVAHEINNPLGYVMSNFGTLKNYIRKYKKILGAYEDLRNEILNSRNESVITRLRNINDMERKENIDFINNDLKDLFKDTSEGLERIGKIITGLRLFSRVDQQNDITEYDLNEGIRNTLIVANNEIKYYADVEAELQDIPVIKANGGQVNQVLLNIIVNAVHAIKTKHNEERGLIRISTNNDDKYVYCCIEDNGTGIDEENLNRIFDPFFTTKSVGKGTGLGLSISYDIVTNKHGGEITVKSIKSIGSSFTIKLPI